MRGETKIELFDAKSGELVKSVTKHNLVTNACKNIINGLVKLSTLGKGTNDSMLNAFGNFRKGLFGDSRSIEDTLKDIFGGVLVFSEPISEDADHIIPTPAERRAYIGGGYQGNTLAGSPTLGSLSAESAYVANDYIKFVWEFTSSQCNGAIACICLTSNQGGLLGFRLDDTVYNRGNYLYRQITDAGLKINSGSPGQGQGFELRSQGGSNQHNKTRTEDGSVYHTCYWNRHQWWDMSKFFNNNNKVNMFNGIYQAERNALSAHNETINSDAFPTYDDRCGIPCLDFMKYYMWKSHDYDGRTGTTMTLAYLDLTASTRQWIELTGVNLTALQNDMLSLTVDSSGWSSWQKNHLPGNTLLCIKEGYAYFLFMYHNSSDPGEDAAKMYKVNIETGAIAASNAFSISDDQINFLAAGNSILPYSQQFYLTLSNDDLLLCFRTQFHSKYYHFSVDLVNLTLSEHPVASGDFGMSNNAAGRPSEYYEVPSLAPAPFCFYNNGIPNAYDYIVNPNIFMPYLATINNQNGLEKDNTKTMKITYTLYMEAENGG